MQNAVETTIVNYWYEENNTCFLIEFEQLYSTININIIALNRKNVCFTIIAYNNVILQEFIDTPSEMNNTVS